jgi:hypothetical protein
MNLPLAANAISRAALPEVYQKAKRSLAKCERIDECKTWADKAGALASYAKQAQDESLMNYAHRIRTRAIDRAGELLKQIEPKQGANQNIRGGDPPKVTRKAAAKAAGMSPDQAKTAIRVNNVPRDDFEKQVESDKPPTVTALAKQGKKKRRTAKRQATTARQRAAAKDDQTRATTVFSGHAYQARMLAREGCKAKRITQAHINICQTVIDAWTKLKGQLDNRRKP